MIPELNRRLFLGSVLVLLTPARVVRARTVERHDVAEEVQIEREADPLRLAGAGVFRMLFLRYYVCALYLAPGVSGAAAALGADRPRRIELIAIRRISAFEVLWGLDRGVADNTSEAELKALAPSLDALRAAIRAIGVLVPGARVWIDYLPAAGTRIVVDNQVRGGPFPGKALNDALLKVWIGERPLDRSLREALLGG